jgi:hypothetical protein
MVKTRRPRPAESKRQPKAKYPPSLVALVTAHTDALAKARNEALAKLNKPKRKRKQRAKPRRSESPPASTKTVIVETVPPNTRTKHARRDQHATGAELANVARTKSQRDRRGNPSRSYSVGLSRGMPGNEESDP